MTEIEMLKDWIDKGMRFVTYGSDFQLLADAALNSVSESKRLVK
jgi:2-keto-3-deoxy-L-rhamnonate aldolase RhmA